MLFTPSPPLSSQSVSSSVESDFSSTHTTSICKARNVGNQHYTSSFSNNAILLRNGPSTRPLASTILSPVLSLSNEDEFYHSLLSSSNSVRPSTLLETPTQRPFSPLNRHNSCPNSTLAKKSSPCRHLSTRATSFLRNVLMATIPVPDRTHVHMEDKTSFAKDNLWSNNNIMPVANPVAAAALVDENEPLAKSSTSSPLNSRKSSIERVDRSTTVYSGNNSYPTNTHNSRKVLLNVGGVRHESNRVILIDVNIVFFLLLIIYFRSFMAYTFSSSEYTSRSFGEIT